MKSEGVWSEGRLGKKYKQGYRIPWAPTLYEYDECCWAYGMLPVNSNHISYKIQVLYCERGAVFFTFYSDQGKKGIVISWKLRISANWDHSVFWEHCTVSLAPSSQLSGSWLLKKKEKAGWVNILSLLGQTSQLTAFLKLTHSCSIHGRSIQFHAAMLVSFALTRWEMRTMCCTLVWPAQYGRGHSICSASPGREMMTSRTDWSPPLPLFGDRKKLQGRGCLQLCMLLERLHKSIVYINVKWSGNNLTQPFLCTILGKRFQTEATVFRDITPWHFLLLSLRTFSVACVCTLEAHSWQRFYITEAQCFHAWQGEKTTV